MLVVCEVALGHCMDFTTLQSGITAPPGSYHSCHGVKTTENNPTEFWVGLMLLVLQNGVLVGKHLQVYFLRVCAMVLYLFHPCFAI